jgi:uncharacterized protein
VHARPICLKNTKAGPRTKAIKTYAVRLKPDQDLKIQILNLCTEKNISAGVVLSSVGSLKISNLRFSDQKVGTFLNGPFEILSLNGTVSKNGLHLHISISDHKGQTLGGHLLDGCLIHTTCELVIGEIENTTFSRDLDPVTHYMELKIK